MKKIILFTLMAIMVFVYYISVYDSISGEILRMHIIANSNTHYDQDVKIKVRDYLLGEMKKYSDKCMTGEDVVKLIPKMEKRTNEFLKEQGISYSAKVKYEVTDIPRKEYNGIILPRGEYSAIRVVLGDGDGENWWCVAYPPLCFTEEVFGDLSEDGKRALEKMVGKDGYRVISSDIKYELKIVEISKKLFKKITG